MRLFIKTYGCQANINDSEILAKKFEKKGYEIVETEKNADTIFINSCSVKNKTQSKTIDYIKKHQDKKIIIGGCLTSTIDLKKQFPQIQIINTKELKRLNQPLKRKDKDIAIIQISQGCLNSCTYCATKLAKGKLKSYPINEIKKEFERALNEGCEKVYLTSQDNGCYGKDKKTNLAKLLHELKKTNGKYNIRVGMMHPGHAIKFIYELLEEFESPKIQKFLHISVQSGSNKVLKEMNRGHRVEDFEEITNKFRKKFPRKKFPESTIATDIIVGYPTETENDFEATIKLIKKIKPEVLNISAFSSRPKTKAAELKPLPTEVVKKRTKELNDIYQNYRKNINPSNIEFL